MLNIKNSHLEIINQEIQSALAKVKKGNKSEDIDRLNKMMEIQSKVQALPEWPFAIQNTFTFLVTLITVGVQAAISISGLLKK